VERLELFLIRGLLSSSLLISCHHTGIFEREASPRIPGASNYCIALEKCGHSTILEKRLKPEPAGENVCQRGLLPESVEDL
jgi:hypothetical protein